MLLGRSTAEMEELGFLDALDESDRDRFPSEPLHFVDSVRERRSVTCTFRTPDGTLVPLLVKEELLHDVWHLDFDPGSNVVEVCVGRLRSKLGADIPIETLRGVARLCRDADRKSVV